MTVIIFSSCQPLRSALSCFAAGLEIATIPLKLAELFTLGRICNRSQVDLDFAARGGRLDVTLVVFVDRR